MFELVLDHKERSGQTAELYLGSGKHDCGDLYSKRSCRTVKTLEIQPPAAYSPPVRSIAS